MNSFLQSPTWEQFNQEIGSPTLRSKDGQLFLGRAMPFGSYFLSSRSQIGGNFSLPSELSKACFLRIEPEDENSYKNLQQFAKTQKLKLESTHAVQPRQTVIISLDDDETMLSRFKPKHRYNLKLAQKAELDVAICHEADPEVFERFWQLLSQTAERQNFRTHAREYYWVMLQVLSKEGMAHLVVISKDGQDLAAMLLLTLEDTATYLHGASSEQNRSLMAPYLMHWTAMQLGKEKGCSQYDLWGSDLEKNKETGEWQAKEGKSSAGTSRFKLGFGGEVVEYPGTFDLILNPFCYTLYKTARALRPSKRAFN